MFRFILTPGSVTISKTGELENAMINGSSAQVEKDQWDKFKLPLTTLEDHCFAIADSLRKIDRSTGQTLHEKLIDSLYRVIDSSKKIRKKLDVDYIAKHPGTYLSMHLLGYRCRAIPVDSVVKFFSGFPDSVTKSSLGNDVLTYVYPLTDNKAFRAKYPLYGMAFEKRLNKLRSMHDFKLTDIAGKEVDFKAFRGKYLVIDVWANWCKPCIANIPAWNALMKQYDPEVIRFMSVAVDEDVAAWKEIVAKHKPGGIQVVDPKAFAGLFAVYSRVVFVPKYLIVDPAGKIINNQAPHPGPELQKLLNSLIEKKN
jgi:thiol-disulfide isomerase/thioredoxin